MQAKIAIKKGAKLLSSFKFLQKYLTESQFLKAVSAHFYGTVFYACSVWYDNMKVSYKNKLRSLHFRLYLELHAVTTTMNSRVIILQKYAKEQTQINGHSIILSTS